MVELRHWLKTLGSLTLGGLIGAAFGALVYLSLRVHFQGIDPYGVIALGGAIGTAVQKLLQPVTGTLGLGAQLSILVLLLKLGIINQSTYQRIVKKLVERRFLGNK